MDKLDAMRMFVRVVESGSFSQAARDLNVSQPTVSKQLAALEARLGTQLLARSSRALAVTPAGQEYYEATVRILQDLDFVEERVLEGQSAPSGLGPRDPLASLREDVRYSPAGGFQEPVP
ncbi:LysR family transcriptional regulator [Neorhizobium tomejilense]|uniref:LysR family transcriptional regulator n=1 Tax=Neorhizobium tomejilense TaxID=2093828 RepID=UPI003ECEF80D